MTIADLHLRAVVPIPFRVCGVELLPMTIGHARILEGIGLMRATLPNELMSAAWICSRPHRKFDAGAFMSVWTRLLFAFWRWRLGRKWNWLATAKAWSDYVGHHLDEPVATAKKSGAKCWTPWLASLRSVCCCECGYDPMTFDDVLIAQATLDYHAYCERNGLATLLNATVSQLREASC